MNRRSITAVAFVLAVAACGGETTAETVATTTTAGAHHHIHDPGTVHHGRTRRM